MAQAASRTPITPHLIHDPAQGAIDQTYFDALVDLVPEDVARRVIKDTGRRERRDTVRGIVHHPLQSLRSAIRFPLELAGWLLYAAVHRNSHPQPKRSNERPLSDTDIVRREVARTWVNAVQLDHDLYRSGESRHALGEDLFPPFPQDRLGGFSKWASLIVHHCQGDIDEVGAGELLAAFAARAKATIVAQGAIDLPGGFLVRKDPEKHGGYITDRRSA